jgi:RNA polymerase I-specific transcription initiation factor RRN3
VRGLSYRSDWRAIISVPGGPSNSQPTRRIIYARIHTLLQSLLSLIPTLPAQLGPLIVRYFPHKGEGLREQVVYVQNLFAICDYAEELRMTVLECVIGRSLEVDVEIQIELDELEEAEADFDENGDELDQPESQVALISDNLLDKPLDDDSDSDDDGDEDGDIGLDHLNSDEEDDEDDDVAREKAQSERQRLVQVRRLADKLDAIMSLLFAHLEGSDIRLSQASKGLIGSNDALTPDRAIRLRNEQFGNLVRIFERSMLPTFKSRHVQFVMFWIASLERNFCDVFVGMLLGKAIYTTSDSNGADLSLHGDEDDPTQGTPMVMRIAASSYVASLVSRARYIDAQDARIVMLNLSAFLDVHLNAHAHLGSASQPTTPMGDIDVLSGPHAMFYAVAQACFYIFCFRWRDLRSSDDEEGGEEGDEADNEAGIDDDAMRNGGMIEWCDGMDAVKRAILSNLNPLAYCSSAVVRQFAGVAQLTGFMYCWNIIERNSRNGRRTTQDGGSTPTLARSRNNSTSSLNSAPGVHPQQQPVRDQRTGATSSSAHSPVRIASPSPASPLHASMSAARPEMDSFFPFDPYRLRGSTKWIEPIYREWSDVAPDGMVSEDEDSDEDGEEEQEDSDEDDDVNSPISTDKHKFAVPMPMNRSARSGNAQNGLNIPSVAFKHRPAKPSKLSKAHGINSPGFGASVSTNESSSIAHSLEAMSISPRFV